VTLERYTDDAPWNVLPDGGTSMHDVAGWFGYSTWNYFYVPTDTEYCDDTLFIKRASDGTIFKAKTLLGSSIENQQRKPSIRYLNIMLEGAIEHQLPVSYIDKLESEATGTLIYLMVIITAL
jgi:hypothetical protein